MSEPKISIIIPVYNVENYLKECLDSCVNQTLQDIEIICVDDCSTDNSYKILEEYQQKDSRIRIFQQEENKKQGAARNRGLEIATGEYIWFVDSDDYIDTKACQILYDAIKEFNVDMLCFSALQFVDTNESRKFICKYYHQGIPINKIYYPKINWREIHFHTLNVVPWAYLTKRCVIQKFRFRERVWHEDADFTLILLASVDSFCYISYTAYFYRINPNSTMQTSMSQKRLEDLIKPSESLHKFIVENKIKKNHFLYLYFVTRVYNTSNIVQYHTNIHPDNLSTLTALEKKYRHSLNAYMKTLRRPRYSLKRFIGKIFKKIFK